MKLKLSAKLAAIISLAASPFLNATNCEIMQGDTVQVSAGFYAQFPLCANISGTYCLVNNSALTVFVTRDSTFYPTHVSSAECSPDWSEGTYSATFKPSENTVDPVNVEVPGSPVGTIPNIGENIAALQSNVLSAVQNVNLNLHDFSKKMSESIAQTWQGINDAKAQSASAYTQSTNNWYEIRTLGGRVSTVNNNLNTEMQRSNARYLDLNSDIQDVKAILVSSESKTDSEIIPKLDAIKQVVDDNQKIIRIGADNALYALEFAHDSKEAALQVKDLLTSFSSQSNASNASLSESIQQIQYTLDNMDSSTPPLCGGRDLPDCPPDGGTSVDLTETNELLTSLVTDLSAIKGTLTDSSGSGTDLTETNSLITELKNGIFSAFDTNGLSDSLEGINSQTTQEIGNELDELYTSFDTKQKIQDAQSTISTMVGNSGLDAYDSVDKVRGALSQATTVSEVFQVSRATCLPYQFWQKELDFCPAAEKTSMVLEYFIWACTAIFAFIHLTSFLTTLRTD